MCAYWNHLPPSPCGTVAPAKPVAPASPCGTVAPRLYDAKQAELIQQAAAPKKAGNMVPAWAFPLFGVVALFSFVSFVTVRRRATRSTRAIQFVEPALLQEEGILSDLDGPVE